MAAIFPEISGVSLAEGSYLPPSRPTILADRKVGWSMVSQKNQISAQNSAAHRDTAIVHANVAQAVQRGGCSQREWRLYFKAPSGSVISLLNLPEEPDAALPFFICVPRPVCSDNRLHNDGP
jgi:hypothetical protein